MQTSRVMNWSSDGFTLIEFMVVLVILAMFIGLGLPKVLETLMESNLSKNARNISLFVQQIRTEAILNKKQEHIYFDLNKHTIYAPDSCNLKKKKELKIPLDLNIEIKFNNKIIVDSLFKVEISSFGFVLPFDIYLGEKNKNNVIIQIQPFLLNNKVLINS